MVRLGLLCSALLGCCLTEDLVSQKEVAVNAENVAECGAPGGVGCGVSGNQYVRQADGAGRAGQFAGVGNFAALDGNALAASIPYGGGSSGPYGGAGGSGQYGRQTGNSFTGSQFINQVQGCPQGAGQVQMPMPPQFPQPAQPIESQAPMEQQQPMDQGQGQSDMGAPTPDMSGGVDMSGQQQQQQQQLFGQPQQYSQQPQQFSQQPQCNCAAGGNGPMGGFGQGMGGGFGPGGSPMSYGQAGPGMGGYGSGMGGYGQGMGGYGSGMGGYGPGMGGYGSGMPGSFAGAGPYGGPSGPSMGYNPMFMKQAGGAGFGGGCPWGGRGAGFGPNMQQIYG